jgi:hypothetical protein
MGSLCDSLPSIEPHVINLLEYNYIVVLPRNEFCELHVFKSKGVQRFLTIVPMMYLTSIVFQLSMRDFNKRFAFMGGAFVFLWVLVDNITSHPLFVFWFHSQHPLETLTL